MRFALFFGGVVGSAACLFASAAFAESDVGITRSVYIERSDNGARALEPASQLRKGDKVVLVMQWRAPESRSGFTVSSAVPRDLAFRRAGSDAAEVSIDGGRSWGRMGALKVGGRLASVEDVTHLRWRVPPEAVAQGSGTIAYSAVVR